MIHLAINEGDDQHDVVHWLQRVTDEEYSTSPSLTDLSASSPRRSV